MRLGSVLTLLLAATPALHAQDKLADAAAECLKRYRSYRVCALEAYGLTSAPALQLQPGDREIRLWIEAGFIIPERLVIIRQRGAQVSGAAYLWWAGVPRSDTAFYAMIQTQCTRARSNDRAGMCLAKRAARPNWAEVLHTLDSLGIGSLPDQRTLPVQASDVTFTEDGWALGVDVRGHQSYRAYAYSNPSPRGDSLHARAAAILAIATGIVGGIPTSAP